MLIAIAGPSTVGKDSTWLRLAETLGFQKEVPYTTRAQRPQEEQGRDYHFIDVPEFQELIRTNQLAEWDYTLGAYYGTSSSFKERCNSQDIVLQVLARMAIKLKRQISDVRTVLLQTSDRATLAHRLEDRGYAGNELILRVQHGNEEVVHAPLFDFVVPDADILSDDEVLRILHEIISSRADSALSIP